LSAAATAETAAAAPTPATAAEAAATPAFSTRLLPPPTDSALLLLMGASSLLERCVAVGLVNTAARRILSSGARAGGVHNQGPSSSGSAGSQAGLTAQSSGQAASDDLKTALESLLSLAHLLTHEGPWWQEARAKYPLLLIETLFKVSVVSMGAGYGSYVRSSPRAVERTGHQ
jgi:hypothetical protein